jgi:cellulose synthase/poly-beta-1,6-N-acetylglucosamine synthase-like glycosyltransferase
LTINFIIFFILSCLYYALLWAVFRGLGRLQRSARADGHIEQFPFISVIIAARNEQERILPCLQHLENIDYPSGRLEIILVDDNSRDNTPTLIAKYCARHGNWRLIRLSENKMYLSGKKNALAHALAEARGEIIFTTDADCMVPPLWLRNMVQYFTPEVSMVMGYSPLIPAQGWWNKILQFDNLFSAIVTAAPAKLGYPFSSAGRNLAYRRSSYDLVGGYQALKKYRSGDDLHLTERFRSLGKGRIDFSADPETFVPTRPPSTGREIFNQQIRKNSKVLKASPGTVIFFIIIFIYYLSILWLPISNSGSIAGWIVLLFIKLVLEWICLIRAVKIFRQESLTGYLPLMQLIYPIFIIFFSLLGMFQKYHWKR